MFHLAKIIEVFSPATQMASSDARVQVQLEMWDENLIIFDLHPSLVPQAQKGQYVLVEYGFDAPQVPRNSIVKILDPKTGESSWKRAKSYLEKRKKGRAEADADEPGDQRMVR